MKKIFLFITIIIISYVSYEYFLYKKQSKMLNYLNNSGSILFRDIYMGNLVSVSGKLPDKELIEKKIIPLINRNDSILRAKDTNFPFPLIKKNKYHLEIDTTNNTILFYLFLPSNKEGNKTDFIDIMPFSKNKGTNNKLNFLNFLKNKNYNLLIYNDSFPLCPDKHNVSFEVLTKSKFPFYARILEDTSKHVKKINKIISSVNLETVKRKRNNKNIYSFVYDADKKEVRSFCPNIPKRPNEKKLDSLAILFSKTFPKIKYLRFPLEIK